MIRGIQRLLLVLLLPALGYSQAGNSFTQTNLVSDGTVKAQVTDPQLINPWGIAIGQQTPFWINTAGSGFSEVYDSGGNKQFVVQIPAAGGPTKTGSPAGIALNPSTTDFVLPHSTAAVFLFGSLDGTISGWNSSLTNAQIVVDKSSSGAAYTGLAIDKNSKGSFILAANFAQNTIDVFETEFAQTRLTGDLTDPAIPQDFAPFNVHVANNQIFVMYALQSPGGGPPAIGKGVGFVSVFDLDGNLLHHAISGGMLDAPWGLAIAPASFGPFGGDLLVGNFGDGTINAFDPTTFAFKDQLKDAAGNPIHNDRLWELVFGQNGTGDPNTLYFSAGVNDEKGGLFGSINANGPATAGDFRISLAEAAMTVPRGGSSNMQLNVASVNGFNAPVSFTVSGLPAGATFQFTPAKVTPGAGGATSRLTISASSPTSGGPGPYSVSRLSSPTALGISASALLPVGLSAMWPVVRKRKRRFRSLPFLGAVFAALMMPLILAGCAGSKTSSTAPNPTPTPVGTSMVTVTATSGAITHTTTFSLTIQ